MFRNEPEPWRGRAAEVSLRTKDITEFLTEFGYAPTRDKPDLRVTYHSACSLQHGQGVNDAPKALLRRAGFTVVEPGAPPKILGGAGPPNKKKPPGGAPGRPE